MSIPDALDTPEVESHAIAEGEQRYDCEGPGRGEGHAVAEVEEGGCYAAENNAEFELLRSVSEGYV